MKTERGEKCNCAGITRFVLVILCKKQIGSQSKMLIKSHKKKKVTFIKWSFKSLWRWCKSKSNRENKIAFSPGHCHRQDNAVLQNKNWSTSRKPCWREEGPEKARERRQSKRTQKKWISHEAASGRVQFRRLILRYCALLPHLSSTQWVLEDKAIAWGGAWFWGHFVTTGKMNSPCLLFKQGGRPNGCKETRALQERWLLKHTGLS